MSENKKEKRGSQNEQAFHHDDVVRVCLLSDAYFDANGMEPGELVPASTQLIGRWEETSPRDKNCHVSINETTWTFAVEEITRRKNGRENGRKWLVPR